MTRRGIIGLAALVILLALGAVLAQTPPPARTGGPVTYPHYNPTSGVLEWIVTGSNAVPLPGGAVAVDDFEMRGFQNGQTNQIQFIAQSPHCRVDFNKGTAGDPGPLRIFTPTNKLYIEGMGFFCADSNQVLVLSNQVETRIVKSLLRASFLPAPGNSPSDETGPFLKIFAGSAQLNFRSNLVTYSGQVRVQDLQFQMLSPYLAIQFTTNQAVEMIRAWQPVSIAIETKGTATGDTATYTAANGTQTLQLSGHAEWRNGDQSASAGNFTYDPDRHYLVADDEVHVRWPAPQTSPAGPVLFRELFADHSTLQVSPDGQLVDAMTSDGNVIIVNQSDHSRALAIQAVYNRTNDLFELKPDADWWNDQMEVWGDTLSAAPAGRVQHAHGHARLKHRLTGADASGGGNTNQWLWVSADDIVSETNLVTFRGNAEARLLDGGEPRDTLTAELLLVTVDDSNQIQNIEARGHVRGVTAADANGVKKTISSRDLTALFWPGGSLLRTVAAEGDAVLESLAPGPDGVFNQLAADRVTAHFSSLTNVLESAEAEGAVRFLQIKAGKKIQASGDRGRYVLAPVEQVELGGHAWARNDDREVTGADRLAFLVKSGAVKFFGRYHIAPPANAAARPARFSGRAGAP